MKKKYRILVPLLFVFSISVAQERNALPEVLITSTPITDTLLLIPAAVNVISADDLERSDPTTIANEINKLPGIQMQQGAINTSRISIRGLGARSQYSTNRVKAYLDGIPLTTGEGETTLEDIDLNLIERIEVIKGPNSSIYGAGLGGVIELTSRQNTEDVTGVDFNFSGGSFGYWQRGVSAFTSSSDSFIKVGYNEFDKRGYRDNSDYDRKNVSLYAKKNVGKRTILSVFGLYTHLKAYIPSSLNKEDFENDPESASFTWGQAKGYESYDKVLGGLSLKHYFNANLTNTTSVFVNYRDGYEPRPFDILDEKQTALGARTVFNFNLNNERENKFAIGAEYLNEHYSVQLLENLYQQNNGNGSLEGEKTSDIDQNRNYLNVFAQGNFSITKKLFLDLGASLNTTRYTLDDQNNDGNDISGKYTYNLQFSPRAGLNYSVGYRKSIYATVSRGFSIPTVAETLTPEGEINPEIKPETGINYELGFKGLWLNNRLYTELALYTIQVDNLIVAERIAEDRYVGVNAGATDHNGIELLASYTIPLSDAWRFNPYGSLAINNYSFDEFIDDEEDYSGNELTGVPRNTYNLGIEAYSNSGLQLNLNLRHMGEIPLNDENAIYSDAYEVVNFRVDYAFGLSELLNGAVFGGVNNVFDTNYAAQILPNAGGASPRFYYPGEPINYYVGIKFGIR